MSGATTLRRLTLAAMGAHLLTHVPETSAHGGTSGVSGASAPTLARPRAIALDPAKAGRAVVLLEESHALPLVDVSFSFRSGAALDPAEKLGRTRLFGRMLRRGAEGWSTEQIEARIDALGGEISVEVGVSSVTLSVQVIRRNLRPFLELVSALLLKPTFPEDELGRLRREIVAELIETRDSDKALASRFFKRAVFGTHPYGRSNQGTTTGVPLLTRDDVLAAYAQHVRRDSVIVGVSGDIDEGEVRALIAPIVEALPAGDIPADPTPEPPHAKGRRLIFVDKPARTQTQVLIGGLGTHASDADHIALHVANTVFGGTFTARMMKAIRSERGWSYGASSRLPIERRREAFSMWTFPAATDAAACIKLEIELLEALVRDGITDDELSFAKGYLGESYAFDIDTPSKRLRQAVDEALLDLPRDYHTGYVEHVRGVTLKQANDALRSRLSADDLTIVVVGTASQLRAAVEAAIPRLASAEVVPFDRE